MKTLYTLLLFMMNSNVFAQTYIPIPESSAVWIQGQFLYFTYHEHATLTQPLSFGNDSIIGGTLYHTLHGHTIADWVDGWGNQLTYQEGTDIFPDQVSVLFRQDIPNKRIYQWDNNTNQEQLLYDFDNLTVGQPYPQTLNNMDYPQILVMAYDSVLLIDGLYHERWVLGSNSNDSGFVSIIEGVGSTMGFDLPITIPFEQSSATLCFSVDGNAVYDGWGNANGLIPPRYSADCAANVSVAELVVDEFDVAVWPNPVNDILIINSTERIEKLVLCDLVGHIILEKKVQKLISIELSLINLPLGNYILKVCTENNKSVTKCIVR